MTAFHITAIVIILFLIIFFILIYREGRPYGFGEWIASMGLSLMIELVVAMICTAIGVVVYRLWVLDWYGFFHDKLF